MRTAFGCSTREVDSKMRCELSVKEGKQKNVENSGDKFLARNDDSQRILKLCKRYIRELIDNGDANQTGKEAPSIPSCSKEFQFDFSEGREKYESISSSEQKLAIIKKVKKTLKDTLKDPNFNLDINQENDKSRTILKNYLKVLYQRMWAYKEQGKLQDFFRLATRFINIKNILHSDLKLIKVSGFWEKASVQFIDNEVKGKLPSGVSQVDGIFAYKSDTREITYHSLESSIQYYNYKNWLTVPDRLATTDTDCMNEKAQLKRLNKQVVEKNFKKGHLPVRRIDPLMQMDNVVPPPPKVHEAYNTLEKCLPGPLAQNMGGPLVQDLQTSLTNANSEKAFALATIQTLFTNTLHDPTATLDSFNSQYQTFIQTLGFVNQGNTESPNWELPGSSIMVPAGQFPSISQLDQAVQDLQTEARFDNFELEELDNFKLEELIYCLISDITIDAEEDEHNLKQYLKSKISNFLEVKKSTIPKLEIDNLITQFVKNIDGFNALNVLLVEFEKLKKPEPLDVDTVFQDLSQIFKEPLENLYTKSEKNSWICTKLIKIEESLPSINIHLNIDQPESLQWRADISRVKWSVQKLKEFFEIQGKFFKATRKSELKELTRKYKEFLKRDLIEDPCITDGILLKDSEIKSDTIKELCETLKPEILFERLYNWNIMPELMGDYNYITHKNDTYEQFYTKKKVSAQIQKLKCENPRIFDKIIKQKDIIDDANHVLELCVTKSGLDPGITTTTVLYNEWLKEYVKDYNPEAKARWKCACTAPHFLDQHIDKYQEKTLCKEIAIELFKKEKYIGIARKILNKIKLAFYNKELCPSKDQLRIVYDILIKDYVVVDLAAGSGKTVTLDVIEDVVTELRGLRFCNNENVFERKKEKKAVHVGSFMARTKEKESASYNFDSFFLKGLQWQEVKEFCGVQDIRGDKTKVKAGISIEHPKLLKFLRKVWGVVQISLRNPRKSIKILNPISKEYREDIKLEEHWDKHDFFKEKSELVIYDDCELSQQNVVAADVAVRVDFSSSISQSQAIELFQMYIKHLQKEKEFKRYFEKSKNGLMTRDLTTYKDTLQNELAAYKKDEESNPHELAAYKKDEESNPLMCVSAKIETVVDHMGALLIKCIKDEDYESKKQALILEKATKLKPAELSYVKAYDSIQDEEGLIAVMCPYNIERVDQDGEIKTIFESYYNTLPEELKVKRKTFIMKDDIQEQYYEFTISHKGIICKSQSLAALIRKKADGSLNDAALLLRGSDQQRGSSWDLSNNKTNPIPMVVLFEKPTKKNKIYYKDFFDYLGIYLQYGQRIRGSESNLSHVTLVGFNPNGYGESTDKIFKETYKNLVQIVDDSFLAEDREVTQVEDREVTQVLDLLNEVLDWLNKGENLDLCTKITLMNIMIYSLRPILEEYKAFCLKKSTTLYGSDINDPLKKITAEKITELMSLFKNFMEVNPNLDRKKESFEKWYSRFLGSNK